MIGCLRWLFRDRRDDDPGRPDWQALVDAVEHAVDIAVPSTFVARRAHVVRTRSDAQAMADLYYSMILAGNLDVEAVDGELFGLDAALAAYPDDYFGREVAVRRYDYLLRRG